MILGSLAAAQDLVQESFLEVIRRQPRHRDGTFGSYLSTVAYHLALKEKRRNGRFVPIEEMEGEDASDSPLEKVLSKETDRAVARVIRSLDPDHRDVLVLRFYGEYSYEAIARMMDLPLGTVKSRIFYAVKACRERMREKGLFE